MIGGSELTRTESKPFATGQELHASGWQHVMIAWSTPTTHTEDSGPKPQKFAWILNQRQ